jgi:hypothetical protein
MSADESSRRKFLLNSMGGVSAAWLAVNWPAAVEAAQRAKTVAAGHFAFFTPAQAADIEAMSAQIFPTDDTAGAREAQVVYFIDLGLVTFARDAKATYTQGCQDLQAKTTEMFPRAASFAVLASSEQIQLLTAIESTPFFQVVREHTIMGMFADPKHGGNYEKVGWRLIGFDDSLNFRPPFGHYDRIQG